MGVLRIAVYIYLTASTTTYIYLYLLPVLGHLKLSFIGLQVILRPPITIIDKIATAHWPCISEAETPVNMELN